MDAFFSSAWRPELVVQVEQQPPQNMFDRCCACLPDTSGEPVCMAPAGVEHRHHSGNPLLSMWLWRRTAMHAYRSHWYRSSCASCRVVDEHAPTYIHTFTHWDMHSPHTHTNNLPAMEPACCTVFWDRVNDANWQSNIVQHLCNIESTMLDWILNGRWAMLDYSPTQSSVRPTPSPRSWIGCWTDVGLCCITVRHRPI